MLESSGSSARLHVVWPYPFPLRNLDAGIEYRFETLADGTFVLSWSGNARPEIRVRASGSIAWKGRRGRCRSPPVPLESRTHRGDLGGKFPRSAEEEAWRAEPVEYFRALRRRLGIPDAPK